MARFSKEREVEILLRYFGLLLRANKPHVKEMAMELGLNIRDMHRRLGRPSYMKAREVAQVMRPRREDTFANYVFQRLSPEGQKLWDRIRFWSEHDDGSAHIEHILHYCNARTRQELFIHALVSTTFDMSKACHMIGVSQSTLTSWKRDENFARLVDEIQFHKKNWIEQSMLDLISQRHPLAVIWANKTINADRGYSEKVRVEHSLNPEGFDFGDLDLDIETRRKVLEAIRRRKSQMEQKALPAPETAPIEVEAEVLEAQAA